MLCAHRCISNLVWWLVLGGERRVLFACFCGRRISRPRLPLLSANCCLQKQITLKNDFLTDAIWQIASVKKCAGRLTVSLHTDDLPARKQSPLKYDWSVEPVHSVKLGLGNRSVSSNKTFCHAYRCSYINIQLSDHRDSCSRKKIDALRKIIIDTIVGFNKVKDLRRCFSVRDLSGQLL